MLSLFLFVVTHSRTIFNLLKARAILANWQFYAERATYVTFVINFERFTRKHRLRIKMNCPRCCRFH